MDKRYNGSSVIYGKKIFDFVLCYLVILYYDLDLFKTKSFQRALKFLLFEIFVLPQCERACGGPLESLAGCITNLCASDFYWIFFSFQIHFIFQFCYRFLAFFKCFFNPEEILLFKHSQTNYQVRLYKLNSICEKLSYQLLNILAVNPAVFFVIIRRF